MKEKSTLFGKLGIFLMPVAIASLFEIPTIAYAYDDHENCKQEHWNKEKQAEFFQKRQIELHDKLALTSVQESAWNKFVNKTKPNEMHKKEDWAEMSKLTTPERLDRQHYICSSCTTPPVRSTMSGVTLSKGNVFPPNSVANLSASCCREKAASVGPMDPVFLLPNT